MDNNGMNYFQNSGYINKRNRKRILILDVEDSEGSDTHLGSGGEFNIQLYEPMIIDKHSEIYLDNFTTFNSMIAQTHPTSGFALKINEFNINSNVASTQGASGGQPGGQHLFNSLIIPNEHRSVSNNHSLVIHKGKKFNYVCDINPQTISSISGKITDLVGNPIFHGDDPVHQYTYALTGITSGKIESSEGSGDFPIQRGAAFSVLTNMTTEGGGTAITGHFLALHPSTATALHFSTNKLISEISDLTADITITTGGGDITIDNDGAKNPNLSLTQGDGRFIAEFSIISRE